MIKRLFVLVLCVASFTAYGDFLSQYKWQNRVILIKSNDPAPMLELMSKREILAERDILWFQLRNDILYHNSPVHVANESKMALDHYFGEDTVALLIGKDGMIKSRDNNWDLDLYLQKIDDMPMRQQE